MCINISSFLTDNGIGFGLRTYPVCLPTTSNEDTEKWENRKVEVVGYATQDFSGTKGDTMKVANMDVFTQSTCNAKLDEKLEKNKECKLPLLLLFAAVL